MQGDNGSEAYFPEKCLTSVFIPLGLYFLAVLTKQSEYISWHWETLVEIRAIWNFNIVALLVLLGLLLTDY